MTPIEAMLVTGIVALAGAVSYMFKTFLDSTKEIKAALNDCQEDREKLWARLVGIEGKQAAH